MKRLYRAMKEAADGRPELGRSARALGVRPGDLPAPDVAATASDDTVGPGDGGMSVAPDDPLHLPRHRRPASLGGTGTDPVWVLDVADLTTDLAARQDTPTHAILEAGGPTSLADYEAALATTRLQWRLVAR